MRLLFLCHRTPYPPDKGEKITSYNLLRHLAARHEVFAGFLVDDPDDLRHLATIRGMCAGMCAAVITPRGRAVRALLSARPGRALTRDWFRSPTLARWVRARLADGIDGACVYSSAMAPYVAGATVPTLIHMADVDSAKWTEYASTAAFPRSAIYAREARTLLALERAVARTSVRTTFVSEAEAALFRRLAPSVADRVGVIENGVDLEYFCPDAEAGPSPYPEDAEPIAFTGAMDYRPNIDAVDWFARAVLPAIRTARPRAAFWIVGSKPAPAVRALEKLPGVTVTGRVPDIRPWMAHAACLVAPLRIARGIQNKVIEGMAMARPVVATPQAFEGIRATAGRDLLVADGADGVANAVLDVLAGRHPELPANARAAMLAGYAWDVALAPLDAMFPFGQAGLGRENVLHPAGPEAVL